MDYITKCGWNFFVRQGHFEAITQYFVVVVFDKKEFNSFLSNSPTNSNTVLGKYCLLTHKVYTVQSFQGIMGNGSVLMPFFIRYITYT